MNDDLRAFPCSLPTHTSHWTMGSSWRTTEGSDAKNERVKSIIILEGFVREGVHTASARAAKGVAGQPKKEMGQARA